MDLLKLILLDPHPSKRLIEAHRLGRSVYPPGEICGIGLQAPEFMAECKAGNLVTPVTEAVLEYAGQFSPDVHFAVERLDVDTLTALALIDLRMRPRKPSSEEVERARCLVATKEWSPDQGVTRPTAPEIARHWAVEPNIDVRFRVAAISEYLRGLEETNLTRGSARRIYEERHEIAVQWDKVKTMAGGAVAVISSSSGEAMSAAQLVSDVAVWVIGSGTPSCVVKIWQRQPGLVNLAGFHEEVSELEVGWDAGSVWAASSFGCKLSIEVLVRLLVKYHVNRSSIVRMRIEEILDDSVFQARVCSGDAQCGTELWEWVKLSHL